MHNALWLQVVTQSFKIYLVVNSRCIIIQMKFSVNAKSKKLKALIFKKCCNLFIVQMKMTKITEAQCRMITKKYTKFEKDS